MAGPVQRRNPLSSLSAPDTATDAPASNEAGDYDALADLFLDGASFAPHTAKPRLVTEHHDQPSPQPHEPPFVVEFEGVVVGHLPVLGAAWITQFARQRAIQDSRPAALVRIADGTISVDLVAEAAPSLEGVAESTDLASALRAAAAVTRRWIIRVEEAAESRLASDARLTSLTLLTGADEAAMVASYRSFKSMLASTEAAGRTNDVCFGVAIFGAEAGKAAESESKLRRAAQNFLGRELGSACVIQRITTCAVANLYRGGSDLSLPQILASITDAASRTRVAPQQATPQPDPVPTSRWSEPRPEPPPQPIRQLPPSAPSLASPAPTTGKTSALAPLLHGLRPLAIRNPYAPAVEFAADTHGALHLIAQQGDREDQALRDLLSTAAWSAMHETLLIAAEPGLSVTRDNGPSLHLVCEHAPPLRRMLDSGVRIHLLVTVGGSSVCRELN